MAVVILRLNEYLFVSDSFCRAGSSKRHVHFLEWNRSNCVVERDARLCWGHFRHSGTLCSGTLIRFDFCLCA